MQDNTGSRSFDQEKGKREGKGDRGGKRGREKEGKGDRLRSSLWLGHLWNNSCQYTGMVQGRVTTKGRGLGAPSPMGLLAFWRSRRLAAKGRFHNALRGKVFWQVRIQESFPTRQGQPAGLLADSLKTLLPYSLPI